MIFSNKEASYLDCGFGSWIGDQNFGCAPYKGWQPIYENNFYNLLDIRGINLTDEIRSQILGGEVNMWSEQVSDQINICHFLCMKINSFVERFHVHIDLSLHK
jgi:hypothetical protein